MVLTVMMQEGLKKLFSSQQACIEDFLYLGVVLATAVAVSGTVIFLSLFREKNFQTTQISGNHEDSQSSSSSKPTLRPCISSSGGKRRKKKRVRFAESVKEDSSGNLSKQIINEGGGGGGSSNYRGLMMMMPANRVALYSGILKSTSSSCSYDMME
ncbi:hypothetical protein LguiB_023157 [Lonicera macranthoides]